MPLAFYARCGLARELAQQPGHDEYRLFGDVDGVARDAL
jgi:hypothetical protein